MTHRRCCCDDDIIIPPAGEPCVTCGQSQTPEALHVSLAGLSDGFGVEGSDYEVVILDGNEDLGDADPLTEQEISDTIGAGELLFQNPYFVPPIISGDIVRLCCYTQLSSQIFFKTDALFGLGIDYLHVALRAHIIGIGADSFFVSVILGTVDFYTYYFSPGVWRYSLNGPSPSQGGDQYENDPRADFQSGPFCSAETLGLQDIIVESGEAAYDHCSPIFYTNSFMGYNTVGPTFRVFNGAVSAPYTRPEIEAFCRGEMSVDLGPNLANGTVQTVDGFGGTGGSVSALTL